MGDGSYRTCHVCDGAIQQRVERFDKSRGIIGTCPMVRDECLAQIQAEFPGWFELITNPGRWIPREEPRFPVSLERAKGVRFTIEFVIAPLPFAAACIRVECPKCKRRSRLINVNVVFQALCSHLLAASSHHEASGQKLASFLRTLHEEPGELYRHPAPPKVDRRLVWAALAWLMVHEFGHIVGNKQADVSQLRVAAPARNSVAEELDADLTAFRVLDHRQAALQPTGGDARCLLAVAVELVLRTLAVAHTDVGEPLKRLDDFDDTIDGWTPSPRIRWENVLSASRMATTLGLSSAEQWSQLREQHLGRWEHVLGAVEGDRAWHGP